MPTGFKQFNEFVKDKDKGKAPVKKIADYPGPISNAPPCGGKPYAKTNKNSKTSKNKNSDWTNLGDKSLVYRPKTDQGMSEKKAAKCVDTVKEFVDVTKTMSPADFAKYIATHSKNSGIVHESIHNTVKLLSDHPHHIADLVRELKRKGMFEEAISVIREMVGPPAHHTGVPAVPAAPEMATGKTQGMGHADDSELDGDDDQSPHGETCPTCGQPMPKDDLTHDMHSDDEDMEGLDDEDLDDMGDPNKVAPPGGMGQDKVPNQAPRPMPQNKPQPSFMSRMMARESTKSRKTLKG